MSDQTIEVSISNVEHLIYNYYRAQTEELSKLADETIDISNLSLKKSAHQLVLSFRINMSTFRKASCKWDQWAMDYRSIHTEKELTESPLNITEILQKELMTALREARSLGPVF